ncbi:DEAD/DEAH box helicase [Actinoalloteichus caeruleus]|uniref:DEAD/DEAH box helicase n=1 Tax=Actinoalloteichus cyanogriseus TaxID=2893586 RepID=UPI0006919CBB|nr:DEAD/DEAH box helicase [Actinoalloteichus caeruleus]
MTTSPQWTYLPDRACWFVWSPNGGVPAAPSPDLPSVRATTTLAVPDGDAVAPRDVQGVEVPLLAGWDWLGTRRADPADAGSLAGWTLLARDPTRSALPLPVAAHCAPTPDGGHVRTAAATRDDVLGALALLDGLRGGGFTGSLRGYQLAGVRWLAGRRSGALLADDMGLGKTVQALALIANHLDEAHLVVCPTSVTPTWRREAARHTPELRVLRDGEEPRPGTLTIVSYARLRRAPHPFGDRRWGIVVCDEAQQVKNPRTLAHRAVAGLDARYRLVMTGTPVENDLGDLWALAQLATPGSLGTRRRFHDRYVVPIQHRGSPSAAARLAALTREFVLRRTKAEVAPELPDRQVVDLPCPLSREQRRLYQAALDETFTDGLGTGRGRRASVLALVTRLKQICNHPAQALGQRGPLPERSGKFDRLVEMLDESLGGGTGCLVFTQYTSMGRLLVDHLGRRHGVTVPFLHGGLTSDARDRIAGDFQGGGGPGVLVLSLRAAGFGLTLTRASTVIHYDRWWNPAVEDQASDRAHRIGQAQPVTIYTLRTAGTLEDHIATVHERKRGLAEAVTSGGEAELLALSDDQLRDVLALRPGAPS